MGMCADYRAISSEKLKDLIADPELVEELVFGDAEEEAEEEDSDHIGEFYSLDKAWHGVHFLLNGDAWHGTGPRFNAVLGGTDIGEDMGYGPSRYLTSAEVKAVANELNKVTADELKGKLDPKAFKKAEISPFHRACNSEDFDWLLDSVKELTNFFSSAAAQDHAVLISLT